MCIGELKKGVQERHQRVADAEHQIQVHQY